ncbi:hypothetical protein GDO81_006858 [Engystomops pustulosus]|uniref:Uncharacterized protein n=1 Tax=Engystomops pustulosus TaxID=76066 RepID=A0AAV7D003_ENGPU|nr:hypothetical protein GDO81_006858 [Engystomops pustulosus]
MKDCMQMSLRGCFLWLICIKSWTLVVYALLVGCCLFEKLILELLCTKIVTMTQTAQIAPGFQSVLMVTGDTSAHTLTHPLTKHRKYNKNSYNNTLSLAATTKP